MTAHNAPKATKWQDVRCMEVLPNGEMMSNPQLPSTTYSTNERNNMNPDNYQPDSLTASILNGDEQE